MRKDITDDEVLQTMTLIDMDADEIIIFRATRHLMSYGVPPCCIKFLLDVYETQPRLSSQLIDKWMDNSGVRLSVACQAIRNIRYSDWARDQAEKHGLGLLTYTPCPACVLAGNFVNIPAGCSCCADEQEHPADLPL